MNSEQAITQLIHEYCVAIDTGNLRAFARLMKHADWVALGQTPGPEAADNLILYADGTPRTKHTITNLQLDIEEEQNRATGHCYVTVFQQTDGFPLQAIFAGDYFDEFERVGGLWRFARREIKNALIGDMSAHLKVPSLTIPGA